LGTIAVDRDEAEAATLLHQARDSFARLGERELEAECLFRLGEQARRQSRWAEAETCFIQAETGFGRKNPLGLANCRLHRGVIALYQGLVAAALPLFREALKRYRRLGDGLGEGNALYRLAECALHQNRVRQARNYLERAAPLLQAAGNILGVANCHDLEAYMALQRGDMDGTLAATTLALPLYERKGDLLGQGNCWRNRGNCAARQGDEETARAHFAKAHNLYARIPDPQSMARVKEDMAVIAKGKERKKLAAEARAAYVELGLDGEVQRLDRRFPDLAPKA
jgi:tetratricopeptide (TPR) repeat protein